MTIEQSEGACTPSASSAELGSIYPPGSDEAVSHGCTCPVIDNRRGQGCGYTSAESLGDPLYWFDYACPLHGHNESIPPETMCYVLPNAGGQREP